MCWSTYTRVSAARGRKDRPIGITTPWRCVRETTRLQSAPYGSCTFASRPADRSVDVSFEADALTVPAGTSPVMIEPVLPADPVCDREPRCIQGAEQALDRGHGQRNVAAIKGRIVGGRQRRGLSICAWQDTGGGHSAHRQVGHDQNSVVTDRFILPDLVLVQTGQGLAEGEILLDRPTQASRGDQPPQRHRPPLGQRGHVVSQLAGGRSARAPRIRCSVLDSGARSGCSFSLLFEVVARDALSRGTQRPHPGSRRLYARHRLTRKRTTRPTRPEANLTPQF